MAIHQTDYATGVFDVPAAFTAGVVNTYIAELVLPTGVDPAIGDILEMAVLPPGAQVVGVHTEAPGLSTATTTMDVGIMSGDPGDDGTRTCGDEFLSAKNLKTAQNATLSDVKAVDPSTGARSVGIKLATAALTGGANKSVLLKLDYTV